MWELSASPPALGQPPGGLVSYSLPWPDTSPLAFLRQAGDAYRVYWENGPASPAFAGYGWAASLTAAGPDRFRSIRQEAAQLFNKAILETDDTPPGVGPRLFGGFAFWAGDEPQDLWSAFPSACFVLPRYQLTCLDGQSWLTVNHCLEAGQDPYPILQSLRDDTQMLRLALEMAGNRAQESRMQPHRAEIELDIRYPMDRAAWQRLIETTTGRIRAGELEKVVLARTCRVQSTRYVEPADILTRLRQKYPDCYRFLFEPAPGHVFYGATPELLAEVSGLTLRTVALAGSSRRGETPDEDATLARELLSNPKERQEHAFVVEALRQSLQPLVSELQVPPSPDIHRLNNIQHLRTAMQGRLAEPCGILPVVEALHPTPAMGGTPRATALRLIAENEPFSRGWYAAPVGWLDPHGDGLFAVAIRSAVSVGHEACLFAGAGIVADSDPDREWRETGLKFRPMLDALGWAAR
ncbi:MAG: isochorismate synthase MenF [Anaerolineae bacterium]